MCLNSLTPQLLQGEQRINVVLQKNGIAGLTPENSAELGPLEGSTMAIVPGAEASAGFRHAGRRSIGMAGSVKGATIHQGGKGGKGGGGKGGGGKGGGGGGGRGRSGGGKQKKKPSRISQQAY